VPKVSEEYLAKKRDEILNAAYAVCMRKPVSEVSMRDIIAEYGFSQGVIYRYFPNLTHILIALIDRDSCKYDIAGMTDALDLSDTPEKIIGKFFDIWINTVLANLESAGKIFFEAVSQLVSRDASEVNEYFGNSEMEVKEAHWREKFFTFVRQKISEDYFKPVLPFEDIIVFLMTSLDGIVRDTVLIDNYGMEFPLRFEKERVVKNLCVAFVLLLSGDEKIIYSES